VAILGNTDDFFVLEKLLRSVNC